MWSDGSMYRINYSIPNPVSDDRSLSATLGDFDSLDEARRLARWALDEYGREVEIHEFAGNLVEPRLVETVSE